MTQDESFKRREDHERGLDGRDYIVVCLMAQAAEVWFTACNQEKREAAPVCPTDVNSTHDELKSVFFVLSHVTPLVKTRAHYSQRHNEFGHFVSGN